MAKGQNRSNREIRKPKKTAAERSASAAAAAAREGQSVASAFKKKT